HQDSHKMTCLSCSYPGYHNTPARVWQGGFSRGPGGAGGLDGRPPFLIRWSREPGGPPGPLSRGGVPRRGVYALPDQYYKEAQRLALKERRSCITSSQYPYLPVLDDFIS